MSKKIINFRLVSFKEKEQNGHKIITKYYIQTKNIFGKWKFKKDKINGLYTVTFPSIFHSKKDAVNWLHDQYKLKPEYLRIYQHSTIKIL